MSAGAIAASLATIGASLAALRTPALAGFDLRLGRLVAWEAGPATDRFVAATTDLGSVYAIVGSTAVLAVTGRRRAAVDVASAGAIAWGAAQAAKGPIRRDRPYQADGTRRLVGEPAGTSWPSGHAAVGAAIAAGVLPHVTGRGRRASLAALPLYVAASRVYVGVHYPTDVVAGMAVGVLSTEAARGVAAVVGLVRRR